MLLQSKLKESDTSYYQEKKLNVFVSKLCSKVRSFALSSQTVKFVRLFHFPSKPRIAFDQWLAGNVTCWLWMSFDLGRWNRFLILLPANGWAGNTDVVAFEKWQKKAGHIYCMATLTDRDIWKFHICKIISSCKYNTK